MLDRLLPVPGRIVQGAVGTGWLGLVCGWALLAFGGVLSAWSIGGLAAVDETCAGTTVACGAAAVGGLLAGSVSVVLAVVSGLLIARGFGPPVHWWVLPVAVASVAAGVFLAGTAGSDAVPAWAMIVSIALAIIALWLVVAVLRQGRAAVSGWIRLDGLDVREAPRRAHELALPVAAFAVASAAGAFGAHVARLLAAG